MPHCQQSLTGRESLSSGRQICMLSHTQVTKTAEVLLGMYVCMHLLLAVDKKDIN